MASDVGKQRYWREHMEGWQASGLSQRGYCQREGLALSSFDHWRRRLKQLGATSASTQPARPHAALTLVPVRVIREPAQGELSLSSPGGWRLAFPAAVDSAWLLEVLKPLP